MNGPDTNVNAENGHSFADESANVPRKYAVEDTVCHIGKGAYDKKAYASIAMCPRQDSQNDRAQSKQLY